jgi:hypothetical protein
MQLANPLNSYDKSAIPVTAPKLCERFFQQLQHQVQLLLLLHFTFTGSSISDCMVLHVSSEQTPLETNQSAYKSVETCMVMKCI